MKEEMDGIYDKPRFGLIVWMFAIFIVLALVGGWLFLRSGRPGMHVTPQPQNNRGALSRPDTLKSS